MDTVHTFMGTTVDRDALVTNMFPDRIQHADYYF